jgi:hypothetical protein
MAGRGGGRPAWLWIVLVTVVVVAGVAAIVASSGSSSSSAKPVDGISCDTGEQTRFHIHAHLAVFVNRQPKTVPAGIGITASCLYWLHSHTPDGVIHIESPVQRTFTLGNYFDIWRQPLSPTQVGAATGPVTAYRDGVRFTGNPRDIPLGNHTRVQLNVGEDVPPQSYTFESGL